jgi:spore coat protein U-like protein
MDRRRIVAALLGVLLGGLWPAGGAGAETLTRDLQVVAVVGERCAIATVPISFGTYQPLGPNATVPLDRAGGISLNCGPGRVVRVQLDQGQNPAAGSTDSDPLRQMAFGGERIGYNLYVDAGRTQVWSNLPPGELPPSNVYPQVMPIYGRIPEAQNPAAGHYTDVVVATIVF